MANCTKLLLVLPYYLEAKKKWRELMENEQGSFSKVLCSVLMFLIWIGVGIGGAIIFIAGLIELACVCCSKEAQA
jgi:hypothetical protein